MRRPGACLALALVALILQACAGNRASDRSVEREIAMMARLLPGAYVGDTPGGLVRVSIRHAPTHRYLLEVRDSSGGKVIQRGELTMMAGTRRVALLYRPGVAGRGLDGRPMGEPPDLSLDRSVGRVELVCGLRIGLSTEKWQFSQSS